MKLKKAIGTAKIFNNQHLLIAGQLRDIFEGEDDLFSLALVGLPAAKNAILREGYQQTDAPFYYCTMGRSNYIISRNDFRYTEVEDETFMDS